MEPDQPHPHRDKHVPEQRSDASDRSSGPATSGPESTAHSQPHEGISQPESPAAASAQARYPGAAPTGANPSREGWSKKIAERVGKMLNTPQRSAALGEEPEHPLDGSPEPIPALHPISMGFLGTIGVGIALGGYYLLTNVGSLMTWIAIALFIALGLDPIVRFMMRKGMTRPLAVAATMVSLLAIFGGFMALIIPTLVNQITAFITRAPEIVDDFLNSDWVREIDRQYAISQRITTEVDRFFGDSGAVTNVFGGVLGVSQTVAQSMFGVLIVLVLAIYFLASLPGMMGFSLRLAPRSKRDRVAELTVRITRSVGNYVMGQATVAILNCLVALVLMSILGVPFTALLTLLVAMLAFIPLVGGVIAGVLVTLVTLSLGWQTALIYAVCYFGYLQVEAYFVSPRIMRRAVAVPGAVAVISVIAGGTLAGVTGALMAIPVAASAMILLREVFIARQDRR
ncbi:AI-2E family transporter [Glutamicibacter sp. NPDC087583]|uniref:AI-2E family transporter n=1 Tax=Glutamicibacter sp. NPDC087583 TaxID=3363995 RepID=UPI0037F6ED5A